MEQIIKVPDIGSSTAVDVIEILVNVGDKVEIDTPLITLESDKASMEIPCTSAGIVQSIAVKIGDKVNMGDAILTLSTDTQVKEKPVKQQESSSTQIEEIKIPDIGSSSSVDVIEIFVKAGDEIDVDTALITLESDKASMEIPSPAKGTVLELKLKVGDKVKTGDLILLLSSSPSKSSSVSETVSKPTEAQAPTPTPTITTVTPTPIDNNEKQDLFLLAGPAVRRMARSLGVNLSDVTGSGRKSRITIEDIENFVKMRLQQPASSSQSGLQLPINQPIDFSVYGEIETQALSKIKRLSGQNLHKAWLQIPHVTQFDKADITDLEAFRKNESTILEKEGIKLTILAFITKALSRALQEFPDFNASLSADGQSLILKKYINIGIAVDTPQGLVVPVIRNADKMSIRELALKMAELSQKARQKALTPADMSGGSFTISSLGGIGGTAFTPIVNHPEVAILGISKASMEPVFHNNQFVPRLMLPLSLSYDHRVIDGAQGARFTKFLSTLLSDIRKIML